MNIKCVLALGLAATAVLAGSVSAQEAANAAEDTAQVATADPLPTETEPGPAPTAAPIPEPQDPLGIALKQVLTAPPAGDEAAEQAAQANRDEQTQADLKALTKFYEGRTFEPVWVTKDGMSAKADAAIGEIKKADDWGLEAAAFTLPGSVATTPEALAKAELTLSKAVLKYARHARGGRIMDPTSDLSSYIDRKPQLLDPVEVMGKFASNEATDAVLRGLHPQHPQFEKLRQAYLKLRDEAAKKEIVNIPDGPLLREDMTHEHVALVRKRLKIGPAEAIDDKPADDNLYDEKVKAAVVAYQEEKGLSPDGLVGRGTRASLNDVQVLSTDKLLANMEQWRWMPADMGDLYVWANIPEFTVRIVKNGNNVIHTERIITGLVGKQTPVFSENLQKVIFRPRWNVPNSIKVRELYPSLLRGGRYFERQGLRLTHNGRRIDPDDVDWDETDIRRFDVHQPPGPGNVLGVVKFAFPNKHLVYMHDTPTKHLFNKTTRAYSHGCVRVRNPVRLAEILLEEDKGWSAEKVDDLVERGPGDNQIDVTRKIPVHVTYFTAWVDDAGKTQMASDVYGHEKRIKLALAGKWSQIAKGADHLAPVKASRYLDDDGGFFYGNNRRRRSNSVGDYVQSILGGGF